MSISYLVKETLGEAIVNDKETRTVVLEFKSIQDAIRVLNVLPFGLNYKIYLLDA
jgi:ABC-type Fe3+-citrate transport system substrate-binding protein